MTRSLGDYTFVLKPAPYYEEQEDKYIQQITKTVVNIGGLPGAWDEPLGLPVEIVPLDKPYANWVGGVFRAVVLSGGEPVPHAEVEVEFLNHEPQIDQRRFDPEGEGHGAARFLQDVEHPRRRRTVKSSSVCRKRDGGAFARSISTTMLKHEGKELSWTPCSG